MAGKKIMALIGDGMADLPLESLGGRTPLEAAETPNMDALARDGAVGLTRNVPPGMEPGSDVAIMSIMGYDPADCYTGRGPIEAASIGVPIGPDETAFRCNLITVKGDTLADYSGGHIGSEDAAQLIAALRDSIGIPGAAFHPGVSFRNLLLLKGDFSGLRAHPPHDHIGGRWTEWLPSGPGAEMLIGIIERSQQILEKHPINERRGREGKSPANSVWPWSGGKAPEMATYSHKYGISGAVISAVDLVQGLGKLAGLDIIKIEGATGMVDTNYEGKTAAALEAIEDRDIVILHVEGADEAAHMGDTELKIEGIRRFDRLVVGPVTEHMRHFDDYAILMLPDHPTPIAIRTHTSEPVPFVAAGQKLPFKTKQAASFSEREAASTGLLIDRGHTLLPIILGK